MSDTQIMSLKNQIKRALYFSGYYSILRKLGTPEGHRLLILMYHDIVDDEVQKSDSFSGTKPSASQFEAHIREATRLFRVMSVEDALAEISSEGKLSEPTVSITFDDGYLSFSDIAYPVLSSYGVTATVFLPTDWIFGTLRPWWLLLEQLLRIVHEASIPPDEFLLDSRLKLLARNLQYGPRSGWPKLREQIEVYLRNLREDEIDQLLKSFAEVAGVSVDDVEITTKAMSWEQVKQLSSEGIRFGAHTESHCNLRFISEVETKVELAKSKQILESYISSEVVGFAYPYGVDDERYVQIKGLLEELGFAYACTARTGVNIREVDPFMLRRATLPHTRSKAILSRQLILDYRQKAE